MLRSRVGRFRIVSRVRRGLAAMYLRWRVRAVAYTALLRDEYPPFGDAPYPAELVLEGQDVPPDRMTVAFRLILAIPHLLGLH